MAEQENLTLAELGESGLLERIAGFAPPGQLDDDAALLAERSGAVLVINTDMLVEDVHFSEATMGPADLGWRAAAANLSDLAAMGCREVIGLTVGLVAPASTPWSWVEGVYRGLSEALDCHGGHLLGGDCSRGQQRLLAITALGRLGEEGAIRRGDGRPGDRLISTGPHGLSRLGLALLRREPVLSSISPELRDLALNAHRRPVPRLDAVVALAETRPSGLRWRVGGTDSSDGLAAAVAAIARTSQCDAELDRHALPLAEEMKALGDAEAWCLGGGEDFELVLALDPSWAAALLRALPGTVEIGRLKEKPPEGILSGGTKATQPVGWSSGEPLLLETDSFGHFQ
ncbi:thiamine-phosphate kinase [Synechococcus sp. CS-1324]|uniref:thiamine-phosphate kinase n=1 Tax=Synechococcus sp. CS-1324 TaxID=2847980 RepID=UPI000DB2D87F|nr:thiamine-phosphate kinase [Synechococcus sp. CS-1324]MCT0231144.1 thiamine-phosphate kinase [Synechococcus sp. CS-1324]PZV04430.1 MAG: thiamine-phosphate kinase [Cyanobium sp.]